MMPAAGAWEAALCRLPGGSGRLFGSGWGGGSGSRQDLFADGRQDLLKLGPRGGPRGIPTATTTAADIDQARAVAGRLADAVKSELG